ncbi:signal recognition particle-docking protein FtsY [Candidatus Micrarchaeota archaeon]|nr:signal recognition particle-docking protein FtsY [Candidatus Micrarchaeota archaeon]
MTTSKTAPEPSAAPAKTQTPATPTDIKATSAPARHVAPIPTILRPETKTAETIPKLSAPEQPKERKLEAKIGILSQIKGLISREVQIQPSELEPMLDELNMALLESDVTLDTAEHIVTTIKTQLSGRKVDKSRVQAEIQAAVKTALVEILDKPQLDLIDYIRQHDKPVKILFLGPNGAGKTTTLAKIAHYLKENDVRCVLAAADTFRAAAIEQLQHHGQALQVPVIKHQYGADPAAVAFDAIAHAKAHGLDVVLIDTAGRQETNYNLLKEMEKINRVVQPDLKLFIGEAVAGHALVEQAKAFNASLKLDGVVLTKVDCDAKGGTSFSVSHEVGVPIVLLGTGQGYDDIRTFDAAWLVSNVLAE